jgi:transposase
VGVQSGARERPGCTGKGNPYLKGVLGDAAAAAGKTSTFLGERYRRLARRCGKLKALAAIARTLLVIIWHLLTGRAARYRDLGTDCYISRLGTDRRARSHVRPLEAPEFTVTTAQAA